MMNNKIFFQLGSKDKKRKKCSIKSIKHRILAVLFHLYKRKTRTKIERKRARTRVRKREKMYKKIGS